MEALSEPKQSVGDLVEVYQTLRELNRRHPDDTNLFICMVEAERQMTVAWHAHNERKRKQL